VFAARALSHPPCHWPLSRSPCCTPVTYRVHPWCAAGRAEYGAPGGGGAARGGAPPHRAPPGQPPRRTAPRAAPGDPWRGQGQWHALGPSHAHPAPGHGGPAPLVHPESGWLGQHRALPGSLPAGATAVAPGVPRVLDGDLLAQFRDLNTAVQGVILGPPALWRGAGARGAIRGRRAGREGRAGCAGTSACRGGGGTGRRGTGHVGVHPGCALR